MKYEFKRSPIQAELTSSEDCQALIQNVKKETAEMMQELERVRNEFIYQENHSKNDVKTFRKGKDVFVKVEDVESLINKILNERGLNFEHACGRERGFGIDHSSEMPTLSGRVRVVPLSELVQESLSDDLLRSLQCHK